MTVEIKLGDILKERGLTQKEFAEMSGLSYNTVSSIVNQTTQIRLETIAMICDALKIEVKDLINIS
jgi:putative transcriptional regulator